MPERASDESGGTDADVRQAASRREFLEALGRRRLLSGDTFKQLELRTGVPKSTLADMLTRHRIPRRDVVEHVIRAYAHGDAEAQLWTRAWSWLSLQEATPQDPARGQPATLEPAPEAEAEAEAEPKLEAEPESEAEPLSTGADEPQRGRRRRRLLVWALVVVVTGAVLGATVSLGVRASHEASPARSGSLGRSASPRASAPSTWGTIPVEVRVYNVESDCRRPRTETCALRLAHDPRAEPSIANRAGEVWHGDKILATCAITDGRAVTDEKLNSSRVWYYVRIPQRNEAGWLPGIRVRHVTRVASC